MKTRPDSPVGVTDRRSFLALDISLPPEAAAYRASDLPG